MKIPLNFFNQFYEEIKMQLQRRRINFERIYTLDWEQGKMQMIELITNYVNQHNSYARLEENFE